MNLRPLGRSPLSVAPLAFGGNVFGWSVDEQRSFDLLDAFVDAGFNLIDTADVYSAWVPGNRGGESETIIGKWLKRSGKRDKVVIATKVAKWAEHPGLSPININQAVDGSLKRLQTDHIDLYQAHEDDATVPLHETLGAFARLIEQGKVRVIGASNYGADRFGEALKVSAQLGLPRYETLQPEYNLAMGECKMQMGEFKEAIQFFSNVVRMRPRNISSWEALIRCLYNAEFFEEALEQVEAAIRITGGKPLFIFYLSAIYFALGRSKEGLLQLEKAMSKAPKLLKKLLELNPVILQYQPVVDVIARYKKNKSI